MPTATGRSTLAGKRWRWRLPCASRRSAPCWPAAGSTSGARIWSMRPSVRPLITATAPPAPATSFSTSTFSSGPMPTASGVSSISSSVPSRSRKNAQSRENGGILLRYAGAAPRGARARHHPAAVPHARCVEQHAPGPAVDVELLHHAAHAAHARALLFRRHGEREVHGGGALLDVVRVDDQRLGEVARRAGELRKQQHALLVVARGDELLRHQVHAVVQARD